MKFAILGPEGAVLTVQDTKPTPLAEPQNHSIVQISDEQAATVQSGRDTQPKVIYFFEAGNLVTLREHIESKMAKQAELRMAQIPLAKRLELAESFIERNGYTAARLVTCMDLLLQAKESDTTTQKPKLVATYQWLQTVKGGALAGSLSFPPVPFTFEEVISE